MAVSPDGNTMATARKDKTVILWDVTKRDAPTRLTILPPEIQPVNAVEFSTDGRSLITASGGDLGILGGRVLLWDITDQTKPTPLAPSGRPPPGCRSDLDRVPPRWPDRRGWHRPVAFWNIPDRGRPSGSQTCAECGRPPR